MRRKAMGLIDAVKCETDLKYLELLYTGSEN